VLGEGGIIARGDNLDDLDWPVARNTRVCVLEALPVQSTASELQAGESLAAVFWGYETMNAVIGDGIAYLVAAIVRGLCALSEIHCLQELKADTCKRDPVSYRWITDSVFLSAVYVRNGWTCFGKNQRSSERKGSLISKLLVSSKHPFYFTSSKCASFH
jgi:hypothetical protein